jgi:hypothetical protein
MSRDSIQQSADYGISAPQILNYLRSSAHPVSRKNKYWVPQVQLLSKSSKKTCLKGC